MNSLTHSLTQSSTFSMQGSAWFLTYKTHLDKGQVLNWLSGNMTGRSAKMAVKGAMVVHESGDPEVPYLHTHIAINLNGRLQVKDARRFDYGDIHPHIKTLPGDKAFFDACIYLKKEDIAPLVVGETEKGLVARIQECATVNEALARYSGGAQSEIQYVNQVLQVYNSRAGPQCVMPSWWSPRPWQQNVMDICTSEVVNENRRKINWFWDKTGGAGKSMTVKWLLSSLPQDVYAVSQLGGARDAATIIAGALQGGWTGKAFVCDLPRAAQAKALYEPLEAIKNGLMTATKYAGKTSIWNEGHVIVMANFLPELWSMSSDRWVIHQLEGGVCTPLTLNEVECLVRAARAEYPIQATNTYVYPTY